MNLTETEKKIVDFIKKALDKKSPAPVVIDRAKFGSCVATVRKLGPVKCVDFSTPLPEAVINYLGNDYRIDICNWSNSHRVTAIAM